MSEKKKEPSQSASSVDTPQEQRLEGYSGSPTTQQMRTVGQRRRDAEEKLEHHLEEARHKDDSPDAADGKPSGVEPEEKG
ncbi:hypothetical protein QFZ30_003845 [Arthrobacter pascens]|uniref:hypothetical protein n=1 Tax=Arthrobacter pascens TaxID=1677 RepID=UPI002794356E|nr:hypothetical protein [Arthrobacter pascens]MDQ0680463.1 hypothetical protein [Arthrobacter pascens]